MWNTPIRARASRRRCEALQCRQHVVDDCEEGRRLTLPADAVDEPAFCGNVARGLKRQWLGGRRWAQRVAARGW